MINKRSNVQCYCELWGTLWKERAPRLEAELWREQDWSLAWERQISIVFYKPGSNFKNYIYIYNFDKNKVNLKKKKRWVARDTSSSSPNVWILLYRLLLNHCLISTHWLSTKEPKGTGAELSVNERVCTVDQAVLEAGHLNFPVLWSSKPLLLDQLGLDIVTWTSKDYKVIQSESLISYTNNFFNHFPFHNVRK